MSFLYFFVIIFVLLFLIGMVKIKVLFCSKGNFFFRVCLKVLFVKIRLFTNFEQDIKLKDKQKDKNLAKIKSRNLRDVRSKEKKKNQKGQKKKLIFKNVNLIFLLFEPTLDLLKFLLRGLKIKHVSLDFGLATEDAYKTAIFYGNFCYLFYSFFRLFNSVCSVEIDKIKIFPNFKSDISSYNSSLCIQICFGRLFYGFLKYIFTIIIKICLDRINKNKMRI